MTENQEIRKEEEKYLAETYTFLEEELAREGKLLKKQRLDMSEMNRLMLEENKEGEPVKEFVAFYLDALRSSAKTAEQTDKQMRKYERLLLSPYFGRVDFVETDFEDLGTEKIYIGYAGLFDAKNTVAYVYDWRAPAASMYYRYEPGDAKYTAPTGDVEGKITLKRQYSIEKGVLNYFFDASVTIRDEILMLALSKNADDKMRDIVETIQKEQDAAIRDTRSKVLVVQGVAGSGKTSVALHRAAFLMYESFEKGRGLSAKNILIVSPNGVFSDYIDEVLPGLGEDNVTTKDFAEIFGNIAGEDTTLNLEEKNAWLERTVSEPDEKKRRFLANFDAYMQSAQFAEVIEKFATDFEKARTFEDAVFDDEILFTAAEQRATFLENAANLSAQSRLNRIALRILNAAEPLYERVRERFKPEIYEDPKFRFEEEEVLEAKMQKYRAEYENRVHNTFEINIGEAFKELLQAEGVPLNVAKFNDIYERQRLLPFPCAVSFAYLSLLLKSSSPFSEIRHVIIDEAQDYGVLYHKLFAKIFKNCAFTVLGDPKQTLGKGGADLNNAGNILSNGAGFTEIQLNKSYRSSKEIAEFTSKILGDTAAIITEAVERTSSAPVVKTFKDEDEMINQIITDAQAASSQFTKLAIITKTNETAEKTRQKIGKTIKNIYVQPVYAAKGLEFDAVFVYGADEKTYDSETDRNLLYVACTRALHKLSLYAHEKPSNFIPTA